MEHNTEVPEDRGRPPDPADWGRSVFQLGGDVRKDSLLGEPPHQESRGEGRRGERADEKRRADGESRRVGEGVVGGPPGGAREEGAGKGPGPRGGAGEGGAGGRGTEGHNLLERPEAETEGQGEGYWGKGGERSYLSYGPPRPPHTCILHDP